MLERGRGHIVIVSSGAGIRSFPGAAVYGATKAAQRGFGEALRHELKGTGRRAHDGLPRPDPQLAPRRTRRSACPTGTSSTRAVPAEPLAQAIVEAVEKDRREVFHPSNVRLLRIVHGLRPSLADAMLRRIMRPERRAVKLPLSPPLQPQLAKSARELPAGDDWCYEPKWDGFRTIVFRDGDEVHLQSRNGKPMNRYFPDIVEQALALKANATCSTARWSSPSTASRSSTCSRSASTRPPRAWSGSPRRRPPTLVAFDLLAEGDDTLLELPYTERRKRLAKLVGGPGRADPVDRRPRRGRPVAGGHRRGRDRQAGRARAYKPGERVGMVKIKRVRTADAVVAAFRFGKEPDTVGSLILGMYDDERRAAHRRPHVELQREAEARAARAARALPHRRARLGRAEPLEVGRGARLGGPAAGAGLRGRVRPHHRPTGSVTGLSSCAGEPTRTRRNASLAQLRD